MGKQLTPYERELYQRLDEVVHYLWDPIGVSRVPQARDEYYSYLPTIFNLILTDAGPDAIAAFLVKVPEEGMGLPPSLPRATEIATLLVSWARILKQQYSA